MHLGEAKHRAIACAARAWATTASKLQVFWSSCGPGNFKEEKDLAKVRLLFKALWFVHSWSSDRKRLPSTPADIEASLELRPGSLPMYKRCPALFTMCLRGKYKPWKKALREKWALHANEFEQAGDSSTGQAKVVHAVLVATVKTMAHPALQKSLGHWSREVGRGVSHHAGWQPCAQVLGVIKKCKGRGGSGVLVLGKMKQRFCLKRYTHAFQRQYKVAAAVGEVLLNAPAPAACSEWLAIVKSTTALAKTRGLHIFVKRPYLWPWLLRSALVLKARAAGTQRMLLDTGFTPVDLGRMAPDLKHWVIALSQGMATAQELFDSVDYDGPPELFSMFTCLFLCPEVLKHDPAWVWERRWELVRLREKLANEWGVPPAAAALLSDFVGQC